MNLDEAHGSGVAWLEAECNGFMSPALPIVLCQDHDIVEELRTLEAEVADGRYRASGLHSTILLLPCYSHSWLIPCEGSHMWPTLA